MSLDSLRSQIDDLDRQIVELLGRRAAAAQEIGRLKAENGSQAYDPVREQAVYERIARYNEGPLPDEALKAIYREVMSASLALERPTRVAFFGPPGTFTHQAARSKFGASVEYVPESSIPDVFSTVSAGRAEHGVVPVENSTEGPVNIAWDILADTPLKVLAEIYLPIHLALLGRGPMAAIRRVYSHAQPLAQARNFLATHLPAVEIREAPSTIAGVEAAAVERGAAAIASEFAAEGRDIEVLSRHVEDSADNETRFFVVGRESAKRAGHDKTALMVSIKDEVGALHAMLGAFREQNVNLTRIQSRPSRRRAWDYVFFLDCEGHVEDEAVKKVVSALETRSRHVQILGSFPMAQRPAGGGS
jgi:chorismate mutase/prephenate dehydratase